MIVNNDTKILVGEHIIKKVQQGDLQIWPVIPYPIIDYVENTRDAVIETGVIIQQGVTYRVKMEWESTSTKGGSAPATAVMAAYDNRYCINVSGKDQYNPGPSTYQWNVGNRYCTYIVNSLVPDINEVGVINTIDLTFKFDNKTFSNYSPISLFSQSEQNYHPYPNRYFLGKIYYFQLWADDVLIRDFIPVNNNGTQGFWDRITQSFYTFYN